MTKDTAVAGYFYAPTGENDLTEDREEYYRKQFEKNGFTGQAVTLKLERLVGKAMAIKELSQQIDADLKKFSPNATFHHLEKYITNLLFKKIKIVEKASEVYMAEKEELLEEEAKLIEKLGLKKVKIEKEL